MLRMIPPALDLLLAFSHDSEFIEVLFLYEGSASKQSKLGTA